MKSLPLSALAAALLLGACSTPSPTESTLLDAGASFDDGPGTVGSGHVTTETQGGGNMIGSGNFTGETEDEGVTLGSGSRIENGG
jgi:hypothetical protein